MIRIQLGAVAQDLVGEAVQVLDVVREPWHCRIITVIIGLLTTGRSVDISRHGLAQMF